MTLEKAIEILGLTPEYTEDGEPIGEADARRLGIEALKLIASMGECPYCHVGFTLPGETKE